MIYFLINFVSVLFDSDTNTKRHISTLTSHTGAVNTACFITDKMFATGSEDNTVKA